MPVDLSRMMVTDSMLQPWFARYACIWLGCRHEHTPRAPCNWVERMVDEDLRRIL